MSDTAWALGILYLVGAVLYAAFMVEMGDDQPWVSYLFWPARVALVLILLVWMGLSHGVRKVLGGKR